jgi:hypothetical protein
VPRPLQHFCTNSTWRSAFSFRWFRPGLEGPSGTRDRCLGRNWGQSPDRKLTRLFFFVDAICTLFRGNCSWQLNVGAAADPFAPQLARTWLGVLTHAITSPSTCGIFPFTQMPRVLRCDSHFPFNFSFFATAIIGDMIVTHVEAARWYYTHRLPQQSVSLLPAAKWCWWQDGRLSLRLFEQKSSL